MVKVDKSMIWECDTNPKELLSLKHSVALIKDLNMATLAEGVETKDQADWLTELGCDYLQGFYFAKPMPKKDFESKYV